MISDNNKFFLGCVLLITPIIIFYKSYKFFSSINIDTKLINPFSYENIFPTMNYDIDKLIISYIDDISLLNISSVNKYLNSLQDNTFWITRLQNKHKLKYHDNDLNYKLVYYFLQDSTKNYSIYYTRLSIGSDVCKNKDNIYEKINRLLGENQLCPYSRTDIKNDNLRLIYKDIINSMRSRNFGGNYNYGPWSSFFYDINTSLGKQKITKDKINAITKIFKTKIMIKFNNIIGEIIIHNNRPIRLCELLFNISKKLNIISIDISKIDDSYDEFINKTIKQCINNDS
jgi:hypothetical protein